MGVSLADNDDDDSDFSESHEINVTPFIDVILVLLIIFMVAAPLSTVDLPVDLPSSSAIPLKREDKPTYVTIQSDLAVAIDNSVVKRIDIVRLLDSKAGMSKDKSVYLRIDRTVPYGEVADLLQLLRDGEYTKVKLTLENVPAPAGKQAAPASVNP